MLRNVEQPDVCLEERYEARYLNNSKEIISESSTREYTDAEIYTVRLLGIYFRKLMHGATEMLFGKNLSTPLRRKWRFKFATVIGIEDKMLENRDSVASTEDMCKRELCASLNESHARARRKL